LQETHPEVIGAVEEIQPYPMRSSLPPHELAALLDALLPLCRQALYSKNSNVGRAGEAAMLYLIQIDPLHTIPAFLDFSIQALDISAVNLSHQAPAALSALIRLIQPALRTNTALFFSRLPDLLRLSLAGIDSNDQNKTIRTLILYRSLTSWIPIGATLSTLEPAKDNDETLNDGTKRVGKNLYQFLSQTWESEDYKREIRKLPDNSLLRHGQDEERAPLNLLLEEAGLLSGDWVLEFLERVFELLRASGEREKAATRSSGVASRHSSVDVHQARNFSRVLKESLVQLFCAMDKQVFDMALRSVLRFLEEETLSSAAKDASLLCQAAASARSIGSESNGYKGVSPGLTALLPVLADDLKAHSTKTITYRVRCLAGAVRSASYAVVEHKQTIAAVLDFALASEDRHLFKTGCKLLRHTLSTLCEPHPVPIDSKPSGIVDNGAIIFGKSASLSSSPIKWHVPNRECIEFAIELIEHHAMARVKNLTKGTDDGNKSRSRLLNSTDLTELRRCLRVVRYSIRGGATILLDTPSSSSNRGEAIPHEASSLKQLSFVSEELKEIALQIRGRLCSFLIVLQSIIASETLHPDGLETLPSDDVYRKSMAAISHDSKVCKETNDIALLLLTRRGAAFRSQESMTVWKAQQQPCNDYSLCAQVDTIVETLQSAGLYGDTLAFQYKDGEDGGKCIPRRLLVTRIYLFHNSLIRNASFEIPKRMRKEARDKRVRKNILFKAKGSLAEMLQGMEILLASLNHSLDSYEGIVDGLYSLSCNSNTQVRGSAISVIDYALTRFGWLLSARIPRIMAAISLTDKSMNGKFGIPACELLIDKTNMQGKRKRLAEALKGALSALAIPRAIKLIMGSHKLRLRFAETLCGTDNLISLMPPEEIQKMIHYIHLVFSPFRSKLYKLPRTSAKEEAAYTELLNFSVKLLYEQKPETVNGDDVSIEGSKAVHWRKMLLACYFLVATLDRDDSRRESESSIAGAWETCLKLLETEVGHPLQQVALGLLGKLVSLYGVDEKLQNGLSSGNLVHVLSQAIMNDHKEDSKYSGGHDAQWSAGIEEIIRDSTRFIAPRSLFPFQRTSQSTGTFKVTHSQLLQSILAGLKDDSRDHVIDRFLEEAKEMTAAPPNEDQRNQQVSSAEIFAGVCSYYMMAKYGSESSELWSQKLLPFLDEAMNKMPFSLSGAYVDALRFSLQFCPSGASYDLTQWMVEKIQGTLWQPTASSEGKVIAKANGSSQGTDGFTAQSKWLFLISAVLIELEQEDLGAGLVWYLAPLVENNEAVLRQSATLSDQARKSWELITSRFLPHLVAAIGHPFDNCRDHIARCLFRICYCHRKRARMTASRAPSRVNSAVALADVVSVHEDPGMMIVDKIDSLIDDESMSFIDRYNGLSCARKFISYCVHYGEAKFEFKDYVIPLLPTSFGVLQSTVEEEIIKNPSTEDAAVLKRSLEADVIKAFRGNIADISVTSVIAYGSPTDIDTVLDILEKFSVDSCWQVRQACIHFLRCFQGGHKFLFSKEQTRRIMSIVSSLLADDRREVASASMAALTGLLVASSNAEISDMIKSYVKLAKKSTLKKRKDGESVNIDKDIARLRDQKISVFFLCASVMAQPYETPPYVPVALAAISKHSFERNAPLAVRDIVKKCCAEYKRTHMSDNWEEHRNVFSQEQIEALEDVISSPHYYC
jgi:proteasome activator subunit 4